MRREYNAHIITWIKHNIKKAWVQYRYLAELYWKERLKREVNGD